MKPFRLLPLVILTLPILMPPVDLLPLLGFAFVAGITPGPNNALLMLSGAHWGFRATLPLFLGIVLGFPLMFFAVGMGLGNAFKTWPVLHLVLKVVSVAYLLWLAWSLARAGSPDIASGQAKPVSFLGAAGLQWVNPKAWLIAVSVMSVYVPVGAPPLPAVLSIMLVLFLVAIPCALTWLLFGTAVAGFLTNPRRVFVFNLTMALFLVLSIVPILF
jgi:threonine/homoserine/homoserine lactone efflux protein